MASPSTSTATPNPAQPQNETKEAHTAFTTSLKTIASNHDSALQARTRTLHENEAALRAQEETLRKTTAELGRQNEGLAGLAEEASTGLKEIGDVQNWAEMLERELLVVEEVVRGVEREDGQDGLGDDGEGEGMNGDGDGKGKRKGPQREEEEAGKRGWMRWW